MKYCYIVTKWPQKHPTSQPRFNGHQESGTGPGDQDLNFTARGFGTRGTRAFRTRTTTGPTTTPNIRPRGRNTRTTPGTAASNATISGVSNSACNWLP